MIEKIAALQQEVESFAIDSADELEKFKLTYLSKKGKISGLFADFKTVPPEQKKAVGEHINKLKKVAESIYEEKKESFSPQTQSGGSGIDLTAPATAYTLGSRHPLSITRNRINEIFSRIGFTVSVGPEIEDDWHVFSALNFPADHPARDMQDTFFIDAENELLLRTHTSSVQIRVMETTQPPIRIVMPGRVFRNEAISARAHCIFHQVEGLYIDEQVSFADLKQTLLYFSKELFGKDTQIRLRPSYFPFTEPSAEMDISCTICKGKGCPMCKYSGWVEIMGCGMVDPNVLDNCAIDSKKYSGFAFGMGIERIAILLYQINDIRLFFENDVRFLDQFKQCVD